MEKIILKYSQNFAKNIKLERLSLNLTQSQMVNKIGIKTQSYQAYESGLSLPSLENLLKICALFNLSLDELFEIKY